jgi:hypothetical protein
MATKKSKTTKQPKPATRRQEATGRTGGAVAIAKVEQLEKALDPLFVDLQDTQERLTDAIVSIEDGTDPAPYLLKAANHLGVLVARTTVLALRIKVAAGNGGVCKKPAAKKGK